MEKRKSCGVIPIYISKTGVPEYLVIHQNNDLWAFPKGHVESGEKEIETARRELFEEVGIENISIFENDTIIEKYVAHDFGHYEKTVVYFVGVVKNKDVVIQEEELQDFAWLSYEKAKKQLTFTNTQKTLKHARQIFEKRRG